MEGSDSMGCRGQSTQATESEGQNTGSTNCETVIQSYVICDT